MDDPLRAERVWMAIAIANWWLLSVGGEAEAQTDSLLDITEPSIPSVVWRRGKRWRMAGIFLHGWSLIIVALLNHQLLPVKPDRPGHDQDCRGSTKHSWLLARWKAEAETTYTCKPPPAAAVFHAPASHA